MRFILALAILLYSVNVSAGEIRRLTPQDTVEAKKAEDAIEKIDLLNVPSPEAIVAAQSVENAQLEYMMQHYTTEQMAQYAIRISRAQRAAAKKAGQPLPEKLTKEQLQSKEALRDYLRSMYNFKY